VAAEIGKRLRVLVADDHPSIRENLRYLLNAEADLQCVGTVKEPLRCIDICRELDPDVLVLDQDMPVSTDSRSCACSHERLPTSGS
jgi:DNA-binding NarL/FixJ family response regulator